MKKGFALLLASASLLSLSCSENGGSPDSSSADVASSSSLPDDELVKSPLADEVLGFQMAEGYQLAGGSLSYSALFYGYDLLESDNIIYNTYRISYLAQEDFGYHLVYVKEARMDELREKVGAMLSYLSGDETAFKMNFYYSHSSDEKIIDGKYLAAAQKVYGDDLTANSFVAYMENMADAKFNARIAGESYFLAFVAESKDVIVKENVFYDETVEKTMPLINRNSFIYDEDSHSFSEYGFDGENENYVKSYCKKWDETFAYEGDDWETCLPDCENESAFYMPMKGMCNANNAYPPQGCEAYISEENGTELIKLPRYDKSGRDLLSEDINVFLDIYGDYKAALLDAYVEGAGASGSYTWAYFDYEKVHTAVLKTAEA